jgi:hypothetical protein
MEFLRWLSVFTCCRFWYKWYVFIPDIRHIWGIFCASERECWFLTLVLLIIHRDVASTGMCWLVSCQYVWACYCDIQMFHARVEFNLCAVIFFGALVEGNLRWLHFRINIFFNQFGVSWNISSNGYGSVTLPGFAFKIWMVLFGLKYSQYCCFRLTDQRRPKQSSKLCFILNNLWPCADDSLWE